MPLLFDIVFFLFCLAYIPYAFVKGKWHDGFWMRMGRVPPEIRERLTARQNIWVHAVSVGEVMAVAGLVDKLRKTYPDYQIVFSTVTLSGFELAKEKYLKDDVIIFAPLDFSWTVRQFIQIIRPEVYVTAETEIWPNLFIALAQAGIPVVQVNGRISDKAYRQYKAVKFLFRPALQSVRAFGMQSRMYADRIVELGARPENVFVVGNTKFDEFPKGTQELFRREDLGFSADNDVCLAGSTHQGEEDILLDIYLRLRPRFPHLRLVIAPRHVNRTEQIAGRITAVGLVPVRFSQIREQKGTMPSDGVLIVDTFGHLRSLYQIATVVFVGKTMTASGGQNIIEPSFYGKPVMIGPHMENFQFVLEVFRAAGAVVQVNNREELARALGELLEDPHKLKMFGQKAWDVVRQNQGATQRNLELISRFIPASPAIT